MTIGTTVYTGGATFAATHDLTINLTGVDILLVSAYAEGASAEAITSVVIDPGGAAIAMTGDAERVPPMAGSSGRAQEFRATGLALTGDKVVRITAGGPNGKLRLWATPCTGYSAVSSSVTVSTTNALSAARSSATGQEVVAHARAYAVSDTQVFTPSGSTVLNDRVTVAGGGNNMTGAVLSAPGAATTTLTGSWSSFAQTWAVSMWTLTPTADTASPTLTSPTGTSTGSTTASGTVSTNEVGGTLYRLASTNATELAATVKAAALTSSVTATGTQTVAFTGLTASTTYYAHYVHTDAAGNDSARVSSASFTTSAAGDTTAPTLIGPAGTGGAGVCSGSVSTNEANGTLYVAFTASATAPTAVQVEAGQDNTGAAALRAASQAVSATGAQAIASGSITAGTRYAHFMHKDAAGNRSTVASSASFVVTAPATAGLTSSPLKNNTGTVLAAVAFEAYVNNPTTGALVLKKTGLTANGSGVVTFTDAALAAATSYRVTWRRTDTGAEGLETLTAA